MKILSTILFYNCVLLNILNIGEREREKERKREREREAFIENMASDQVYTTTVAGSN
jgi:hypothetical protein